MPTVASMEIDDDDIEEQMHHLTQCRSYWEEKMRFDTALDAGSTMPCPSCGVQGRKDGMCTHMSCAGCGTEWCYVCGLDVEKCDKANGKTSIYDHNEGFQKNPKRCPMYLNQLQTVDEEWSVENLQGTLVDSNEDEEEEDEEANPLHNGDASPVKDADGRTFEPSAFGRMDALSGNGDGMGAVDL